MTSARSDALVLFGATGDLAYKKIFPALQAMIRAGELTTPIIGIARGDGSLDTLRARARESLVNNGGLDEDAFARLSAQLRFVLGKDDLAHQMPPLGRVRFCPRYPRQLQPYLLDIVR